MIQSPLSCEEVARLGKEIYANQIEPHLVASQTGKTVAIDVPSRRYQLGENPAEATAALGPGIDRSQVFLVRVGSSTYFRHGFFHGNRQT